MYLSWTLITICIVVELLFLYNGVFLFVCVVVVQGEAFTAPVVLYKPVSWFGCVFQCLLLGSVDLELDIAPLVSVNITHTAWRRMLDSAGVFVGLLVRSVVPSYQSSRSTVTYIMCHTIHNSGMSSLASGNERAHQKTCKLFIFHSLKQP